MNNSRNKAGTGTAEWLMNTAKRNPEGMLLLAAGCALLLRNDSSRGEQRSHTRDVSRATDAVSNAASAVSETADHFVSKAGEYADDARRSIVDQSTRMVERGQTVVERIVHEQPLAVAIAGLAAGAAVAAAFSATQVERQTLGPAGQRVSDMVSTAGERLNEAASAVGERLMDVAEEKGLNADGLREVARDVAGTFGKSLGVGQEANTRTGDRQSSSRPGATGAGGTSKPAPRTGVQAKISTDY